MGQLGFFDLIRRYESLDEKSDPLVAIAAMVPFESFRSKLKAALIKGELRTSDATRKSLAGRNWDEVMIFKALVLQALYNLCDDQAEYQLRDRLSFMRFPTPRLCGSIARRWGKRARWKSCLICLTGC